MSTNDDLILQGYYKTLDVITAKKIKQNKKKKHRVVSVMSFN